AVCLTSAGGSLSGRPGFTHFLNEGFHYFIGQDFIKDGTPFLTFNFLKADLHALVFFGGEGKQAFHPAPFVEATKGRGISGQGGFGSFVCRWLEVFHPSLHWHWEGSHQRYRLKVGRS